MLTSNNPTLASRVGYDRRLTLNRNTVSLNSEFSSSNSGCFTKDKETSLPYYLHQAGLVVNRWFHVFCKRHWRKEKQDLSRLELNLGRRFHFPTTITSLPPSWIAEERLGKCMRVIKNWQVVSDVNRVRD